MNINALLSPEDAPSRESPASASSSPRKHRTSRPPGGGKRTASGLSQEITRSPKEQSANSRQATSQSFNLQTHGIVAPNFRPLHQGSSTPLTNGDTRHTYGYVKEHRRPAVQPLGQRHSSMPQMEALAGGCMCSCFCAATFANHEVADLASMQHHQQQSRSTTSVPRNSENSESTRSSTLLVDHAYIALGRH